MKGGRSSRKEAESKKRGREREREKESGIARMAAEKRTSRKDWEKGYIITE